MSETVVPFPQNERHVAVLEAAIGLIGERGLAGASLRELAKRVGVSQPSLYHYFDSKEALVGQAIRWVLQTRFPDPSVVPVIDELEQLVGGAAAFVLQLYSDDRYVAFVRFLLAITREGGEWTSLLRERFVGAWRVTLPVMAKPLIDRGELLEDDLAHVASLLGGPMLVEMLNQRVLLGTDVRMVDYQPRIAFLAEVISEGLRARARRRRDGHA